MDINEYISSGVLENYVFGTASSQEKREVECLSHIYPEIKEALTDLQKGVENLAFKVAVPPPPHLKEKVLASIQNVRQVSSESETKVVQINGQKMGERKPLNKVLNVASILLLIGMGTYAYILRSDLNASSTELAGVNTTLEKLENNLTALNDSNAVMLDEMAFVSNQLNFLKDENTQKVQLSGTEKYADNLAAVFWNNESEKVLLDIQNLPELTADESYQLWVLVDGEPIDMGVFNPEITSDSINGLIEMKMTAEADAFAITREPFGGSVSPSLDNLHVIGTI